MRQRISQPEVMNVESSFASTPKMSQRAALRLWMGWLRVRALRPDPPRALLPCGPVAGVNGWSADQVALSGGHSDPGYGGELGLGFDAFRDRGGADLSGKLGQCGAKSVPAQGRRRSR
jgi:hypothetical protein